MRRFLDSDLRLRTACIFDVVGEVKATRPAGFVLPDGAKLLTEVKRLIGECKSYFAQPAVTENQVPVAVKKAGKAERRPAQDEVIAE